MYLGIYTYILSNLIPHLFERLLLISWKNNRDCQITMSLSLKTMEVQIKGDRWNKRFRDCAMITWRGGWEMGEIWPKTITHAAPLIKQKLISTPPPHIMTILRLLPPPPWPCRHFLTSLKTDWRRRSSKVGHFRTSNACLLSTVQATQKITVPGAKIKNVHL